MHGYGGLVTAIEDDLCDIKGLENVERERSMGRQDGPQLVWQNGAGRKSSTIGGRSNPVARAWRLSYVWLSRIATMKNPTHRTWCTKRVRHFVHDLKVDDPGLLEDKALFVHCQQGIHQTMLMHQATVAALGEIAMTNADLMEEAAAKRAQAKCIVWRNDGPAAGLGRQHWLSRVATGWIPNRSAPGDDEDRIEEIEDEELDTEFAAEAAQTAEVVQAPTAPLSPMGSLRKPTEQRSMWGKEWGIGKPRTDLVRPAVIAMSSPAIVSSPRPERDWETSASDRLC